MQYQGYTDALELDSASFLGLMTLRIKCPGLIHLAALFY